MKKLNEFFKLNVFLYHYDIINNEVSKKNYDSNTN